MNSSTSTCAAGVWSSEGYPSEFLVGCAAQFCRPKSSLFLRPKPAIFHTRFQTWRLKFTSTNCSGFTHVLWKFYSIYQPITLSKRSQHIVNAIFIIWHYLTLIVRVRQILLYALMDPLKTVPDFSPVITYQNCTSSWRTAVGTTEDRGRRPGTTKFA